MDRSTTTARREHFGRLLGEALFARDMTQADLARAVDSTQGAVSAWVNGKAEPAAFQVFRIESVLDVHPGFLSATLGYLPVEAVARVPSIEDAIRDSVLVDEDLKPLLFVVLREVLRKSRHSRSQQRGAGPGTADQPRARRHPG